MNSMANLARLKIEIGILVACVFFLSGKDCFPARLQATLEQYTECGFPRFNIDEDIPDRSTSKSVISPRIYGGFPAKDGDWPWMVYVYEKPNGKDKGFICGGTLVGKQWVVTAGHCITQPNNPEIYGVILGKLSVTKPSGWEVEADITEIVRHPQFDSASNFNNDIALMKLAKPVRFTECVKPVCLLPPGFPTDATTKIEFDGKKMTFAGKKCTALGWGQTPLTNTSAILRQVDLNIIPRVICEFVTKASSHRYEYRTVNPKDPKFCAGGGKEDTCKGDSGGPLLCYHDDGRYYLHGITSYGPCGVEKLPGIYTKATDFHDWIVETIIAHSIYK